MSIAYRSICISNTPSISKRSIKFAYSITKFLRLTSAKLYSTKVTCTEEGSRKPIDGFLDERSIRLALNWDAKSFKPSNEKKNYKIAVENLKDKLRIVNDKAQSSVCNQSMETVVLEALEFKDLSIVENKLEWCLDAHKYPSFDVLKALAQLSVESKNSNCVGVIRNVMKVGHPAEYIRNAELLLYASEVLWKCGRVSDSLKCLEALFKEFKCLKNEGRFLLSRMIAEAIKFRNEDTNALLIKYAQNLVNEQKDYFPIMIMWYYLFTSQWFIDQQAAAALLDTNTDLKPHLSFLIEYAANKFLKSNQVQDVLRLLELVLKLELHDKYAGIQSNLFNYHYFHKNMKACTEILKTSVALNIPLSEEQRNKYTKLLMSINDDDFQKLIKQKTIKLQF